MPVEEHLHYKLSGFHTAEMALTSDYAVKNVGFYS